MKLFTSLAVLVLFASLSNAQAGQRSIADFAGMAGCWERRDDAKDRVVSEYWMKPAGTSIMGTGRTVKSGKTVDYEAMRIEERADGIYFVARPSASKDDTSFKLKTGTANEFVFENPAHDFPQRVIYKVAKTTLHGRIEGTQNGKAMGIDFSMTRVKCD